MAFPDAAQLTELLQPLLEPRGLDVEDVKTTKAGKKSQVIIRIDGDQRPSSDVLEEVSNQISEFFDAKEESGELNFGAGYTLEVSTPGVDLPLTAPRHWRRNRGRLVAFELTPGKSEVARIGALSDDASSVALITTVKKDVHFRIERLENIARAVVEIEFAKPSAAEQAAAQQTFEYAEQNSATREDEK
ncbi:ribosome maturation factor RimP [Corynebacterium striatum]|uniref:Ribosome maturation factor RimP n=1 Tax=Corynebacterium striatum TaxID=43770 RepID=A0A2Z2IXP7_CORST|nr:ribosome maturation factor RimP [Corynebacterium striatum]ART21059.1 ribosome maturation factor RimP [Corynebacterium striatum]HCG2962072.1 ribosome maturation factor RimP [Corynebacterium striatum]